MDLSTLKRLRVVVPGTTFVFFLMPVYMFFSPKILEVDSALKFPLESYGAVLSFILGTLFNTNKVRRLLLKGSLDKIDNNIKDRLLHEGLEVSQDTHKIDAIKKSKKLMNILYGFVDSDESLKERKKLVMDNGLVLSSSADVTLIGLLFAFLYFCLSLVYDLNALFLFSGWAIALIAIFSWWIVHLQALKLHIELGNDQIDLIVQKHKTELRKQVLELFD